MESDEVILTDAVERRRLQNRKAQRKFRYKRSLDRAIQAAQLDSTNIASETAVAVPQDGSSSSWPREYYDSFNPPTSLPTNEPDRQQPILDQQDSFLTSCSSASTVGYASSDSVASLYSGLADPLTTQISSSIFQNGDSETQLWSFEDSTVMNADPLSDANNAPTGGPLFRPSITNPFLLSSTATHPPSTAPVNTTTAALPPPSDDTLSSLHIAAQKGHTRIVRLLLAQVPSVDALDYDGRTALHHAVHGAHHSVARLLVEHGARVDRSDAEGRTPLHWAVLGRSEEGLRVLLEGWGERGGRGEDVDALDGNGWTALHNAVERGFEVGVQMLLGCGADSNRRARRCPYTGNVIPPGQGIEEDLG